MSGKVRERVHLYIVRHGQCRAQCEPDNVDPDSNLSPLGEQQSRLTGQHLAQTGVTHIVSSPLVRALSTADAIAASTGCASVQVWIELREGYSQRYQGLTRAALRRLFPRVTLPPSISARGWEHGGDTYAALLARAGQTLVRLLQCFGQDDHVVVVTHGGFANYLLHALLRAAEGAPVWLDMENGVISTVRFVPEAERETWPLYPPFEVELLGLNDVAHLAQTPGMRSR